MSFRQKLFGLFGYGHRSRRELLRRLDAMAEARGAPRWAHRFEPKKLHEPGGALHLELLDGGPRAQRCVVFMPGTNAYCLLYGEFLTRLADAGFHVVAFDPRGHGQSDGPRGSYTLDQLISDLDRVVQFASNHFGLPVLVAGSSQGGITSFYYAAELVSQGGPHPVQGAILHNLADLGSAESTRLVRFPSISRALSPLLRRATGAPRWLGELPIPMEAYLNLRREPVRGLGNASRVLWGDPVVVPFVRLRTLASLAHRPLPIPPEAIKLPMLVLHAERDSIFPGDYVRKLSARLSHPMSQLRVYPNAFHYMIVDEAETVAGDVVSWVESLQKTGKARVGAT